MRTKERDQHFLVKLSASNTIQSVGVNRKGQYFSKLYLWPASGIDAAGLIVANAADIYVGRDGDGPRCTPDALDPAFGVYRIEMPEDTQMALEDIFIQGTAGDGVFVTFTPVLPPLENKNDLRPTNGERVAAA